MILGRIAYRRYRVADAIPWLVPGKLLPIHIKTKRPILPPSYFFLWKCVEANTVATLTTILTPAFPLYLGEHDHRRHSLPSFNAKALLVEMFDPSIL
jgi:hypothetical protein